MQAARFFNLLEALRKDRRLPENRNFREHVKMRAGAHVLCESKQEYDHWTQFRDALSEGHINPYNISLKQTMFECLSRQFGSGEEAHRAIESWNTTNGGHGGFNLLEAGDAVSTTDFKNIIGQIVYSEMLNPLPSEELKFTPLIPVQQTPFSGEKIAGVTQLGDDGQVVGELETYPTVGVGEDWIETPETTKRGLIVPVSKEAVFFDRTGQVLNQARDVGSALRIGREKRAIDCIIDENRTKHRFRWRGTTYATYQTTTPWDNTTASNALVDWTDIDNSNQTFNAMTDPNTGEPIVISRPVVITTQSLDTTVAYIRGATETRVAVGGFPTSGNPSQMTVSGNIVGTFEHISSALLAARLATDTTWFHGDPRAAFRYMENWPQTLVEAPTNNPDEFHRDIVAQFKASERGEYATIQPRFMGTNTA